MTAALPTPKPTGASGEARTFYFERDFGKNAVKILPGEFFVAGEDIAISTVLGSCVSACIWDRTIPVGGMNHFMLPDGGKETDPVGLSGRYGGFAMEQLINELIKRGARKQNLEAKVFGGGAVMRNFTTMNVGERNAKFVLDFLRTEGIRVASQDLEDIYPRRVVFFPASGRALCKKLAQADASLMAAEQQYTAKIATKADKGGDIELF
ncbi:MAG TPA: chemoreceptor glutamine deamidase CheD [Burkholderiaceae bacterium]|nr:chemoreceptor glutamine deamidase CheD [Burkholderiaceae bacterium]